jgi:hypothetical protein
MLEDKEKDGLMKADLKWDGIYHLAIWNSYLEMAMICVNY